MAGIVLEPLPLDYRRHGARYERLTRSLRAAGWDPSVAVNHNERRSAVTELVVRLQDHVDDTALDDVSGVLAAFVGDSLARRKTDRGRVVIYGVMGSVLRIAEIPEPVDGDPRPRERRQAHTRMP